MAATTITVPTNSGAPSGWNFTWTQTNTGGGSNPSVYQPTSNNSNPIQTLVFMFNGNSVSSNGDTNYTAITNDSQITLSGGGSSGSGGNAIQMGSDGSGTLKIDFNRGTTADNNKFILDLSNTTSNTTGSYSFIGNIETSYGNNKTYSGNSYFQAKFGASVKGNITLDSAGKATGENSIPNALEFSNGAKLDGNLSVGYEDTYITFAGNGGGITGNVSKTSTGKLNIVFDSTNGGSIGSGTSNTIKTTAEGATTITNLTSINVGSISASSGGSNTITLTPSQALNLSAEITVTGGKNKLVFNKDAKGIDITLTGNITSQSNGGYSGENTLALNANNVTLGADNKRIALTIDSSANGNPAWDSTASNLILLNGTQASKAYITSMSANGNYGTGAPEKSYNILSFNQSSGNTLTVGDITSGFGANIIGKDYLKADSNGFAILNKQAASGNTITDQLFDTNGAFITANFMNSANAATFASLTIDGAITANKGGTNFINTTNEINIGKAITANNGNNYISAGTINATGTITAQTNGNNYIISSETVTIASLVAKNAGYNYIKAKNLVLTQDAISGIAGGNKIALTNASGDINISQNISIQSNGGYSGENTLALNANNVTLGADNKRIALTIDSSANGNPAWDSTASNLILLNGTQASKAYITSMSANGNYGTGAPEKSYNILSFNQSSGNTLTVGDITSGFGANIIGKDYLKADSNGFAILNKQAASGNTITDQLFDTNGAFITANFMNSANAATFASLTIDGAITANKGGTNFINTTNEINIGKAITANNGNNYISAGTINATGTITAQTNGNNYIISSETVTIASLVAKNAGYNYIKAKNLVLTQDAISGIAGGNKIALTNASGDINISQNISIQSNGGYSGENTLVMTSQNANLGAVDRKISITLGNDGNQAWHTTASNLIQFNGSQGNNAYISTMSAEGNWGSSAYLKEFNILSFDASTTNNTISIDSISAVNGNNIIGKGFLETNTDGFATLKSTTFTDGKLVASVDSLMSDAYAVEGVLTISKGIYAGSNAKNIIAYKATSSANSTIINGDETNNTAISGSNNNIYLNVSASNIENGVTAIATYLGNSQSPEAYSTLANHAVIAGDIVTSGTTNIKIVGKANDTTSGTTTNHNQIGILGNITTNSGTTNIVLQDAFFAPSEMIVTGGTPYGVSTNSLIAPTIIGGSNAGNITTANGAVTNVVTRFTQSPAGNGYSLYNVNNQGSGKTNIVLQGDYKIGANVNYGGSYDGEVNMIFATSNDSTNDTFTTTSTDASTGKVAGVTYKNGLKLTLKDKSIKVGDNDVSFVNTYGHYFTAINNGNVSTFTLDRETSEDIVNINGLVLGSISPLSDSASKHFNITINESSAYVGSVDLANGSSVTLTMKQGSKLLTDSDVFYVRKLALADNNTFSVEGLALNTFAQNNTIIDLATMGSDLGNVTTREQFRLFAVGDKTSSADTGLQGSGALFRVYVNDKADQTKDTTTLGGYKVNSGTNGYFYSDRIIIADTGNLTSQGSKNAQTHYIQVVADGNTNLNNIHYNASLDQSGKSGTAIEGNIAVATVKNDTTNITQTQENQTQALVVFKAQDTIQGFDQVVTTLIAQTTDQYGKTDTNGSGGWTTYFVNSMNTKGATSERAETSAATLATNYDLYMANFNSLNKRMGELRENDHSQGVWARVFNGSQSNEFGLGTKTSYTTIQGGYDYAFGFEGANNYLGVALSYSMSNSEVQNSLTQAINDENIGFDNVKSNAVEVAIYNSYVQDEGWYNDSIAKFSYIMSDFNIFGQDTTYNTNNMAFTLSDEFGYRFKLGSEKEWMIDPQLEVAFGYFDQTELKQTLGGSWLNTLADSVITMRSRFGSSFGYDFKKFTQNKAIKASVYVGAFYEYDYVIMCMKSK